MRSACECACPSDPFVPCEVGRPLPNVKGCICGTRPFWQKMSANVPPQAQRVLDRSPWTFRKSERLLGNLPEQRSPASQVSQVRIPDRKPEPPLKHWMPLPKYGLVSFGFPSKAAEKENPQKQTGPYYDPLKDMSRQRHVPN